jgi:hypothetical protein
MEGSVRPRVLPTAAFFKPEVSPSADEGLRRLSAAIRGPIRGEFSSIKTRLSRGF